MGYYTEYSLAVSGKDELDIIDDLRKRYESAAFAFDEDGAPQDSCKWYDHETDMKYFSSLHPDLLFTLTGDGEESGDIWVKYFKNGKMQLCKAKIVLDPFDESQLK